MAVDAVALKAAGSVVIWKTVSGWTTALEPNQPWLGGANPCRIAVEDSVSAATGYPEEAVRKLLGVKRFELGQPQQSETPVAARSSNRAS